MTTTAAERAADQKRARWILDELPGHFRDGGLLLVSIDYGTGARDYLRVATIEQTNIDGFRQSSWHLTWAMAKMFGYSLRDKNGYWHLAMDGGGYSKPDQLARDLAGYYGLDRVRYEII